MLRVTRKPFSKASSFLNRAQIDSLRNSSHTLSRLFRNLLLEKADEQTFFFLGEKCNNDTIIMIVTLERTLVNNLHPSTPTVIPFEEHLNFRLSTWQNHYVCVCVPHIDSLFFFCNIISTK